MELSRNTVPMPTLISSSEASRMGATAAMALPPQIAVPTVTRMLALWETRKNRPRISPADMLPVILSAVYRKPLLPALSTSARFIPNPRAMTES